MFGARKKKSLRFGYTAQRFESSHSASTPHAGIGPVNGLNSFQSSRNRNFLSIPTSAFRFPTSKFPPPPSTFQIPTSKFPLPHSDFRLPISHFRLPPSEFFPIPISHFKSFHLPFQGRQAAPKAKRSSNEVLLKRSAPLSFPPSYLLFFPPSHLLFFPTSAKLPAN
jgi:hypothetical protein